MLLKVGELARHTGLTVRTLHHYDSIGLLRPSARSEGGYRLYDQADVARLHGIQALRGLGLPLEAIGQLLGDGGASLPGIVERQLQALQQQIQEASALRDRLQLVQDKFSAGDEPALDDWLATLQLMTTCGRHFSAAEMKRIFANWRSVEPSWQALAAEVEAMMASGVGPLEPCVQPLAQRWMSLMHGWMQGDFDLMLRWGRMYLAEPAVQGPAGIHLPVVTYIEQAVQLRLSLLLRYITEAEMHSLVPVPEADWRALATAVHELIDTGVPADSLAARALVPRWQGLLARVTRGDGALLAKLQRAYDSEPLLRLGAVLPEWARDYLAAARSGMQAAGAA